MDPLAKQFSLRITTKTHVRRLTMMRINKEFVATLPLYGFLYLYRNM